ncbi:MAG: class I SAM-dependent methyltransferase [Thermodesulfobacteriota bacterium]
MTGKKNQRHNGNNKNARVIAAYERHAKYYNHVFGRIFEPGRRLTVKMMNCRSGDNILEVGVGTGLSLPHYPEYTKVVGIDLCPQMLAQASQLAREQGLNHVELLPMDAQDIKFEDNTFDKVSAMYIASVVPNPRSMLSEIKRVCKPDGDIFILNHFSNSNRLISAVESLLMPLEGKIGFKPLFHMDEILDNGSLDVVGIYPVSPLKFWTLIHIKNS